MKIRTDLFTRLNNGQKAGKSSIEVPYSKFSLSFLQLLQLEGYIDHWHFQRKKTKKGGEIPVIFVYFKKKAFLTSCQGKVDFEIRRVSTSPRPFYSDLPTLWKANRGLSIYILSTHRGLITDRQARQYQIGGEILCIIR